MKTPVRATPAAPARALGGETDASTRQRVARPILEHGPSTAAELSERLGLTAAGIRRHLDVLVEQGRLTSRERRVYGSRGRGRPAKVFALTDAGRGASYAAYDELAVRAIEFLAAEGGPDAVSRFATSRIEEMETRYRAALEENSSDGTPAEALASALSARGVRRLGAALGRRRTALPAPLPGGPRRRALPATLRGRDRSLQEKKTESSRKYAS